MKSLILYSTAALAALITGPALAVDYVQCNAMRVAFDRDLSALTNQRIARNRAGLAAVNQRCGLPPIAGAAATEQSAWDSCALPAYDAGAQQWDKENGELDPKTGKRTPSRYAMSVGKIGQDMILKECPMP